MDRFTGSKLKTKLVICLTNLLETFRMTLPRKALRMRSHWMDQLPRWVLRKAQRITFRQMGCQDHNSIRGISDALRAFRG